jgi:hypothetical protein
MDYWLEHLFYLLVKEFMIFDNMLIQLRITRCYDTVKKLMNSFNLQVAESITI